MRTSDRLAGRSTAGLARTHVLVATAALCVLFLVGLPFLGNDSDGRRPTRTRVADERVAGEEAFVPQATYERADRDLELRLWEVLNLPRFQTAPSHDELVAEVVALGPRAIPLIFAVLSGEFTETFEARAEAILARPDDSAAMGAQRQDAILIESLTRFPAHDVLDHLDEFATGSAPLEQRLVAARVLRSVSDERALTVLLNVVTGMDPAQLANVRVRRTLEEAMLEILLEQPEAIRFLERDIDRMSEDVLPLVARSLPVGRHTEGLGILFRLLDRDQTLDVVVVSRISELAGRIDDEALDDSLWRIQWLMNNPDWNLRRESAVALGNLQDHTSCPVLIGMLDDPDRRVRRGALWALRNMSERRFDEDSEVWRAWYEEQRVWFETTAVKLEEQLLSDDKGQVLEAVAGLCQRPLYRHHAAKHIGPLVLEDDPQLVRAVCSALTQTRSRRSLPYLLRGLDHIDEQVVQASWRALKVVTGLSLPPERLDWEEALAGA